MAYFVLPLQILRVSAGNRGRPLPAKDKRWRHESNSTNKKSLYSKLMCLISAGTCLPLGREAQCTKWFHILLTVRPKHIPLRTSSCPCPVAPPTSSSPWNIQNPNVSILEHIARLSGPPTRRRVESRARHSSFHVWKPSFLERWTNKVLNK